MKTKEELNALKTEVEEMSTKLAELSEEELDEVSGGVAPIRAFIGQISGLCVGNVMAPIVVDAAPKKARIASEDNIKLD